MRLQASVLTQEFYPICTQEKSPTEANAAFQLSSMFHLKETKQLYFITIKISVSISQNAKAVICLLSEGSSLLRRCLRPEKQLAAHTLPKVSWASLGKRTKPGVVLWEPDSSCDGSVGPNLSALPPSLGHKARLELSHPCIHFVMATNHPGAAWPHSCPASRSTLCEQLLLFYCICLCP